MSIPFFNNVLATLGKRVNYDAVVNYAGNSFAKDSWKLIQEANPMVTQKKIGTEFMNILSKANTTVKLKDSSALEMNPFGPSDNPANEGG